MFEMGIATKRDKPLKELFEHLQIAYAAGLSVWIFFYFLVNLDFSGDKLIYYYQLRMIEENHSSFILNIFLFAYLFTGFTLWFIRKTELFQICPLWICTSVLGSITSMLLAFSIIDALYWEDYGYLLYSLPFGGKLTYIILGSIMLCLYTMPFTYLINNFPVLRRKLRALFT